MFIYMIESRKGTEDGFIVKQYDMGTVYEVRENLGRSFIAKGWAKKVNSLTDVY